MEDQSLIFLLELSRSAFFQDDPRSGLCHLAAASQALEDISVNQPGTKMTHQDWDRVVNICISLDPLVMVFGNRDALRDLNQIHYQATQWRDR
jgi:hypothetical protein